MLDLLKDAAAVGGPAFTIVAAFIWYLSKRDKASREVARECHQSHERTIKMSAEAISENTSMIQECKETMGGTKEVLRETNRLLLKLNGDRK